MEAGASANHILVVDDHEDIRDILTRRLIRLGFEVQAASSGSQALALVSANPPALIVLDYMMPEMTGLDVLIELRKANDRSKLPVIMATAKTDEETIVECLNAGANDFVSKPVALPVLSARIEAQLERRASTMALMQLKQHLEQRIAERTCELTERNQALTLAFEKLELADNAKSLFLASVSHELRTPLNAIIGLSELIQKEILGPLAPAKYCDFVAEIHRNGHYLLDIVSALLDATKYEKGIVNFSTETVDLSSVVAECVSIVKNAASNPIPRLSCSMFSSPAIVLADRGKLKQAITNILSNALKFTDPTKSVEVKCWSADGFATIEIADEGPGMPEDRIQDAVAPFVQIHDNRSMKNGGIGLGLHIANLIINHHDGKLELRNRKATGLSVSVILPLA